MFEVSEQLTEKFREAYSQCRVQPDGCVIWTHSKFNRGYGRIHDGRKGRQAHRVSYRIFKGEIPEGLLVRHLCNTPLCVNPDHLAIGTVKDNTADMFKAGRQRRQDGEFNPLAKLTWQKVEEIRRLIAEGYTSREIAMLFSVSEATLSRVKHNVSWNYHAS